MPIKIVVTAEGTLKDRYNGGWKAIRKGIDDLVKADARRGVKTEFVALDDASFKQNRAVPGQPLTFKAAIDHAWHSHKKPDYMLILGGPEVVPHQSLRNPVPGDDDPDVPSDLPYASDAPASDRIEDFIAPTRVVGRLPEVVHADLAAKGLASLLRAAATWKPKTKADYRKHFALSAQKWRRSTNMSLRALFGSGSVALDSPASGPPWKKGDLAGLTHFINCHGATLDPQFYGERDEDFPVAYHADELPGKVARGTVVAAECCFGAEVYTPGGALVPGISMRYLQEGAIGFVGSTNVAYGPSASNASADLICRFFLESVLAGGSLGRALLEARLRFVREESPLNPVELKTIGQFILLGDPSLRAIAPAAKRGAKAFPGGMRAHEERRGALESTAARLAKGTDQAVSVPTGASPPAINARLAEAARDEGAVPDSGAKAYSVRAAEDPASRLSMAKKAFGATRFHVLVASQPQTVRPAGTAEASRPLGMKAKARKRRRPANVSDKVVLVAKEVRGKVEEVERLFAHGRAAHPHGQPIRGPRREEAREPRVEERSRGGGARDRQRRPRTASRGGKRVS